MNGEPHSVGSNKMKRSLRSMLTVGVLSLTLTSLPTVSAGADPVITNPTEALAKLGDLSRQSEQTSEALHNARIDLDAKLAAQRDAEAKLAGDQGLSTPPTRVLRCSSRWSTNWRRPITREPAPIGSSR